MRVAIESAAPEGGQSVLNQQQEIAIFCILRSRGRPRAHRRTADHLPPFATTCHRIGKTFSGQSLAKYDMRPTSSDQSLVKYDMKANFSEDIRGDPQDSLQNGRIPVKMPSNSPQDGIQ